MSNKLKLTVFTLCFSSADEDRLHKRNEPLETEYTLSNDAARNEVLAFQHYGDGHME